MISLLSFIFAIGIAVLIHEFGHFIFAKRAGVYVQEFAIGMGPKIFSTKKGETTYSIRLLPIGGFVSMAGEGIEFEVEVPRERFIQEASWINKFLIFFMGAGFNFLLAITLVFGINLSQGVPSNEPIIGELVIDGAAMDAGLKEGDILLEIDGTKISKWEDIAATIDDQILVKIDRDGTILEIDVTPIYSEEGERYYLGINSSTEINIVKSFTNAIMSTFDSIRQMFVIIGGLISGDIDSKHLAGPAGIYQMAGRAASAGIISLLSFTAFLSINLGFVNLLPIPALDGGRILILLFEGITRKRINEKLELRLQVIGFSLMIMLLIYATYNDILRFFQ